MDCLFCKMVEGSIPTKKIYEDDKVIVILDLHPEANGHSLIIPKKHFNDFTDIDDNTLSHIYSVAKKITPKLMEKMNATGLTLSINYKDRQLIKHFHMHVLPDLNKKVIYNQDEAYEILKDTIF